MLRKYVGSINYIKVFKTKVAMMFDVKPYMTVDYCEDDDDDESESDDTDED